MNEDFAKKIARELDYSVLYDKFRMELGMTSGMADDAARIVIDLIDKAKNN